MRITKETFNAAYDRILEKSCIELDGLKHGLKDAPPELRNKFTYSLVMILVASEQVSFDLCENAIALLSTLTPVELERMFPVTKEYDGERWGLKDYFTCKEALSSFPHDEPIYKNGDMFELLWDYHNPHLRMLMVRCMAAMDEIRRNRGEISMMEEFCQKQNIPTYEKFNALNGKEYLINRETGEYNRVKTIPKHLKIVK